MHFLTRERDIAKSAATGRAELVPRTNYEKLPSFYRCQVGIFLARRLQYIVDLNLCGGRG
jgi:hypothetical protein